MDGGIHVKKYIFITSVFLLLFSAIPVLADDPVKLPEVKVTAGAEKDDETLLSPGTVSIVRPQEMKGEQKNLPELLKQVPGLHVIEAKGRGAYTVASVRGSTASEVSVFVDGTLMNLTSEAAVDLSAIPVENVERIEVYRGYVPARFAGASMGGVINIITKKPASGGGSVSIGTGSYGRLKTNLLCNMPLGDGKFLFGAGYERSDGDFEYHNDDNTPYTPEDDYTAERQNNGYRNTDFLMKWNDDDWSLRASWKRNDRDLPCAAPAADKPDSARGARLDTDEAIFSVSRRFKTEEFEWGVKADYTHQNKKYDDPDNVIGNWSEQHNQYTTDRYGAALDGAWNAGENNLIEFLGDYTKEKLNAEGDIVNTFGGTSDFSRESSNLQIQDTIALDRAGTLTLTPIIRWNMWDGDGKFSAAGAIAKDFGRGWSAKITGGSYNRAPNLYELYGDGAFVRPNQELQWENGTQWDLGVSWKGKVLSADVTAALTYFGRHSDNLIEYVMTNPRYGKYFNIGKADINGLEFEGSAVWKKWRAMMSLTWMDARNSSDDYRKDRPLPNRPKYEGYLRLSRDLLKDDRANLFAEFRYVGKNYFDFAGSIKMDDTFTTGLGCRYRFSDKANVVFGVDDIFDKSPDTEMYAVYNGPSRTMWFPMQGRTYYATFTWEF